MIVAALLLLAAAAEAPFTRNEPALVFGRVSTAVVVVKGTLPNGTSQGSGVLVGKGVAITNYHVVKRATALVVVQGGITLEAKLLRFDEKRDLALLSFDGLDRRPVVLGEAKGLKVGDRVYAIGAPHGLELTLSDGLVSSLRDDGKGSAPTVQTTAPISPGSSGGGLFDGRGRLVGITTFQTSGQNLNFAHPVEWVAELLKGADSKPAADAPVAKTSTWSVTSRPKNVVCKLDERSVWGLFSDGPELLETQSYKFDLAFWDLDGQAPQNGTNELVLRDLSRKSQFVAFEGASRDQFFFVFDDDGIKLIKAELMNFKGQPRLVTRSGPCSEVDRAAAIKSAQAPSVAATEEEKCIGGDAAVCLRLASGVEGGLALVYYRRTCEAGETDGCFGAARLYDNVGDKARAEQFRASAKQLRPNAVEKPAAAAAPAKPASASSTRTPLRAK